MEIITMLDFLVSNPRYIWSALSLLALISIVVSVVRAHFDESNGFDIMKLFAFDSDTGKMSDSKVKINSAFVVTSWAFIFLTMNDKLTEWYVAVYLSAWVFDRYNARKSKQAESKAEE